MYMLGLGLWWLIININSVYITDKLKEWIKPNIIRVTPVIIDDSRAKFEIYIIIAFWTNRILFLVLI